MKILKTRVASAGDNRIFSVDTIEHQGGLWLVPQWTGSTTAGVRRPMRIIRIDLLRYQKPGPKGYDYLLNDPVPIGILFGQPAPQETQGFLVITQPDMSLPGRDMLN
jgi:hypothetical protein